MKSILFSFFLLAALVVEDIEEPNAIVVVLEKVHKGVYCHLEVENFLQREGVSGLNDVLEERNSDVFVGCQTESDKMLI